MPAGTPTTWLEAADAKEVHLAFPAAVYSDLQDVLFPDEGHPFHGMGERGAFCVITKSTGTCRVSYLVENVVTPNSEDDLRIPTTTRSSESWRLFRSLFGASDQSKASMSSDTLGYEFSEGYHERAVERARDIGGGLLRVHTHPGGVHPSGVDKDSAAQIYKNDRDRLPMGAPFGAAITNERWDWSARVYEPGNGSPVTTSASRVRIVGPTHSNRPFEKRLTLDADTNRNLANIRDTEQDSTIQLWGEDGQRLLADLRIGLVGCGGVGSILAEHLARLGIGHLVLVDFDRLEEANFNRAQGATRIDIRQNRLKTKVAERIAHEAATADGFDTTVVDGSVVDDELEYAAVPGLLDCDLILSGVDAARPRKVLNHLARAHCIPVIDGGSKLHATDGGELDPEAKAETAVSGPGWPCFECQRVWTPDDVEYERDNPAFRGERGYVDGGVNLDDEDRSPSVIGVNALAAGLMQHRLMALALGVAMGTTGTLRVSLQDAESNWSSRIGCQADCSPPPVAAGDRHQLPTGTGWSMRYERQDIPMPETQVADDATDLLNDDLLK